jgi:hypothetical protein
VSDSFRRFLKDFALQNPEYQVDISKGLPMISDYGNIQIEPHVVIPETKEGDGSPLSQKAAVWVKPTTKQLYAKLATKVGLCIKRKNIAFVVGGSRDLFQAITDAYLSHQEPGKVTFV